MLERLSGAAAAGDDRRADEPDAEATEPEREAELEHAEPSELSGASPAHRTARRRAGGENVAVMADQGRGSGLPIGEVLKRARTRQKVDIRTVEEQTKIRTKYLRALENEEWDVLPGPAYAKGFLRTYAQFLGLDGDALVDEYRRTVESSLGADPPWVRRAGAGAPPAARRGAAARWPCRSWAWRLRRPAWSLVSWGRRVRRGKHVTTKGKGPWAPSRGRGQWNQGGSPRSRSTSRSSPTTTCWSAWYGHGRPLIDSQTLISGSREGPFSPRRTTTASTSKRRGGDADAGRQATR